MRPRKNETVRLTIVDISTYGEGIGKYQGFTIFVKNALPGEEVDAKVFIVTKSYAIGKATRWHSTSPHRIKPSCPHFGLCGGCQLLHCAIEGQLTWKQKWVTDCLERIAGIASPPVKQIIPSPHPLHYRNKVQVPVQGRTGDLVMGYFQTRTHRIIDLKTCMIQPVIFTRLLHGLREIFHELRFTAYREDRHEGMLRHIVLRGVPVEENGERIYDIAVGLVIHQGQDKLHKLTPHLIALNTWLGEQKPKCRLSGCFVNFNHQETSYVYGKRTETLWGDPRLSFEFFGLTCSLSPTAFLQVNPEQMKTLAAEALRMLPQQPAELLLDLYCGIGTFALALRDRAKKIIGIEENPQAIHDAIAIAKSNNVEHAQFIPGRVEDELRRHPRADVMVLDPPRNGLDRAVTECLLQGNYQRLIYISCHPATLARDMSFLKQRYRLVQAVPVDMFPQTTHVETVCLLERN